MAFDLAWRIKDSIYFSLEREFFVFKFFFLENWGSRL